MKSFCLVAILVLMVSSSAGAAELRWALIQYPADLNAVGEGIKKTNNQEGMIPVGIESSGGIIHLLYMHNSCVGAQAWSIETYRDVDSFKRSLSSKMEEGFTPVDISYEPERVYVLYLRLKTKPDSWQWVVSRIDGQDIKEKIAPLAEKGFIPLGITVVDNKYGILLVHSADRSIREWRIDAYSSDADEMKKGMNDKLQKGFLPWGLIASKRNVNVMFLAFSGGAQAGPVSKEEEQSIDGVWYSDVGQKFEINLSEYTLRTRYGSQLYTYAVVGNEKDNNDIVISAQVKSIDIEPPPDYPEILVQADRDSARELETSLAGEIFLFKLTPSSGGAISLTFRRPGAKTWSAPERFARKNQ